MANKYTDVILASQRNQRSQGLNNNNNNNI